VVDEAVGTNGVIAALSATSFQLSAFSFQLPALSFSCYPIIRSNPMARTFNPGDERIMPS